MPVLLPHVPHAVRDEEAELERIARQAEQADVWDSEIVGNALKVRYKQNGSSA